MKSVPKSLLKLLAEVGPLTVFFIANLKFGIFEATAAFMIAVALALPLAWYVERRLPVLPLIGAVMVGVFGTLTLVLQDETFIKLKPTIVNVMFALILVGGVLFDRPLLKWLLGSVLALDPAGWRKLTLRWAVFFLALAVLNEIVWRGTSTDIWINFKVFVVMPLTLIFSVAQFPLIRRHLVAPEKTAE